MKNRACSICASPQNPEFESDDFKVWLCGRCGHREAEHGSIAPASDYYEHTPTDEKFVTSLRATRRRQAGALLDRIVPLLEEGDGWVDFGCGRGLFLEEARQRGMKSLGGYETSAISRAWLVERGFPMAASAAGESFWPDWESLPFAPRVVSLFDVLEHFPGMQAEAALRRVRKELPDLKWIVLKVPVSNGILFRLAGAVKKFAPGIYRQLFQVGTFPPHYQYYSRGSLDELVKKTGLVPEFSWDDSDLDNLFHRIPSLSFLPGGRLAAWFIGLFPGDTRALCLRIPENRRK